MKLTIARKISGGYILASIAALIIGFIGYTNIKALEEDIEWVTHTENAIIMSKNILSKLQDSETGQRGFLITGEEHYLEPFDSGKSSVNREVEALLVYTSDNPVQTNRILQLQSLIRSKIEELERTITLRRNPVTGFDDALEVVVSDEGQDIMDNIRVILAEIIDEEESLLTEREKVYKSSTRNAVFQIIFSITVFILIFIGISFIIVKNITVPLSEIVSISERVCIGEFKNKVEKISADELGSLGASINKMTSQLDNLFSESGIREWHSNGLSKISEIVRGGSDFRSIANDLCQFFPKHLNCQIVTFYILKENKLELTGSYAFNKGKSLRNSIDFGEGFVGQAALEKQIISLVDIPEDYTRINSSIGDQKPRNIVVVPFLYNKKVQGVMEIGSFEEISDKGLEFLESTVEPIGITINSLREQLKNKKLLEETQRQARELETRQEELRASNEELEEQTQKLLASEEELKAQQEELRASNEELEEKTNFLEKQKNKIEETNIDLEVARNDIEKKAKDLEISSKYKSEFLANMSHELRTPLNSMLILSRDLANNKNGNLTDDQIESAQIVYNSGNDLLQLINEILDLAKVEAGKMTLNIGNVELNNIKESLDTNFKHVTEEKGLKLKINVDSGSPVSISTDRAKLEQILRNLISNAFKFTEKGDVNIEIHRPHPEVNLSLSGLIPSNAIAISVTDTGIGIPEDKQREIFEAFKQVDGTTSRQYDGTGLGLSISRELAKFLGGEILLESTEGKGSTFTLYLPEVLEETEDKDLLPERRKTDRKSEAESSAEEVIQKSITVETIEDDRDILKKNDKIILAIEDDIHFAKILRKCSRENSFKFIHAGDGETGLELAKNLKPEAIILDIKLPGKSGVEILDSLKSNMKTRHIPVHMMSVEDENRDLLRRGASNYIQKPIDYEQLQSTFRKISKLEDEGIKSLLIIENDDVLRKNMKKLIGNGDIETTFAGTGDEAIKKLKKKNFDCIILDMKLPDMSGYDILKNIKESDSTNKPPVIIYTGKDLTKDEIEELQRYSDAIIYKDVKSDERLLDEVSLFLHRVVEDMPEEKRDLISKIYDKDAVIKGKNIMLVDDDMRNVYALSKILEDSEANVITVSDGKKAIDFLKKEKNVDLILMDIMMPVMDGYETMRHIRKLEKYKTIPILALTAKAMKDDADKCVSAGANDYITKPVDIDRLFSLLRAWLY
ncbi:MAG: response regulator [bacterium]|nr:response regulator [bacterium]